MLNLSGFVKFDKPYTLNKKKYFTLEVKDSLSGLVAMKLAIYADDLGRLVCEEKQVECEFEFNDSGNVGMVREEKEVEFYVDYGMFGMLKNLTKREREKLEELVAPLEIDGWRIMRSDALDYNRVVEHDTKNSRKLMRARAYRFITVEEYRVSSAETGVIESAVVAEEPTPAQQTLIPQQPDATY